MFKLFLKLFIIYALFFSNLLFSADGNDIHITVSDSPIVQENAGTSTFNIQLSEAPEECEEVVVTYHTQNGSAKDGEDYNNTSGSVTFYGHCSHFFTPDQEATTNALIQINIINDEEYEVSQYFDLLIANSTIGYKVTDHRGRAWITDDDTEALKLITFKNKTIRETDSDQLLWVIATFNQTLSSSLIVTYHTEDNSAVNGIDYNSTNTPVTISANRALIPIVIKGDLTPEITKNFKVIIDSISEGTITADKTAIVTIKDNDKIEIDIRCFDTEESNSAESNNIRCEIFLVNQKPYPSGEADFNIDYISADGSPDKATAGEDYTAVNGHVTFTTGDINHTVNIPTIGDNKIEPDENVKLVISGSSYIIDTESEAEIINDDGEYPGMGFGSDMSTTDFYVVEGNSSQRNLNFIFSLDSPALAGTSFEYYTVDKDANQSNDYIPVSTTIYSVHIGDTNITIPIKVNGDTDIENDETFYLKIKNEKHLNVSGHTAKGHIINDDGSYPTLSFNKIDYHPVNGYSITEGDSGTKDINFTLTLDKPALENSHFDYRTENGSANGGEDFFEFNRTTYHIAENEQNITISVKVKGDMDVEEHEDFYFKIDNESENLHISGDQSLIVNIKNDDHEPLAIKNVGEFRFDDCGVNEWKIDHSYTKNHAVGTAPNTAIITENDKNYMCSSVNGFSTTNVKIPHHSNYEITEGTVSILLYDHHNTGDYSLLEKGTLDIRTAPVEGDANKGTIDVHFNGHTIHTNEIFFTNGGGGDSDSQWIQVTFTFGQEGMKLYINGALKGTDDYIGGMEEEVNDIVMSKLSGYYDEFYIFEGQMNNIQVNTLYQNTINNKNLDGTDRDCGCYLSSDPFTCNNSMYISSSVNRETSATGKMWLHKIDTTRNPFDFEVMEDTGATEIYNATAYNPDDNYIYGLYHRELIRLSRGAEVTNLGTVALPIRFNTKQLYAGAISNGYYYVSGRNSKTKKIFKIKLSDTSIVTDINLSKKVAMLDFSFYKNVNDANSTEGVYLYGIDKQGKLTKIDVRDGTVTQTGSNHTGYEFDSSFSDKNGRFFANDGNGNGFFEFNLNTGAKTLISNSQFATFNDGANCINSALVFNDYGDAPSTYGIPKHNIANGIFMGANIDHDITPTLGIDANGDDTTGIDDEDGVTFVDGTDINGSYFEVNGTQSLKITVSKKGYLNAWLDFGIDGTFNTVGDKIISSLSLTAGTHTISFNIPATVTKDQLTYLRLRYASTPNLNATQDTVDGEVEDYAIKFGSAFQGIKGQFNVQRTNSAFNTKDFALYTQIVGRDFDYHVVFYDENMTQESELVKVPVRIDLIDANDVTNAPPLYTAYYYFSHDDPKSRILVLDNFDLNSLPATQEALFKITYATDANGAIVQQECGANYKNCFESLLELSDSNRTDEAQDKFAIRPESFYITLSDGNIERTNSNNPNRVNFASGYDYNLTIMATKYRDTMSPIFSSAIGYNRIVERKLDFNSSSSCTNSTDDDLNITITDGLYNDLNFTTQEVGYYILKLPQDNNWTAIDQNGIDCKSNRSFTSQDLGDVKDFNIPSGCDIVTKTNDIQLNFHPYQFSLNNLNFGVLPVDDNEFIYMDSQLDKVGVQLRGELVAQNAQGNPTRNFTQSCVATNLNLILDVNITSDSGVNTPLQTTRGKNGSAPLTVAFNRSVEFNNDSAVLMDSNITNITTPISVPKERFLDINASKNGSIVIDLRYNISKNIKRTINPIKLGFKTLTTTAPDAQSNTEKVSNWIPRGVKELNSTRFFYFTQVAPDKLVYPRVNFTGTPVVVNTPLSVDIFCKKLTDTNFCKNMKILDNTLIHASPRKQKGWYISSNHNENLDGNITSLNSVNPISLTVDPNSNIPFIHGQNYQINSTVADANHSINQVNIIVPSQLQYLNPNYSIPSTGNGSSEWSGIGGAGHVLSTKPNTNTSGKNDW